MGVTLQQVQDALAKVATPRGVALSNADVLSPITANDGKVFFSINVEATEARAWESVSAAAEAAVRAIPGVEAVMVHPDGVGTEAAPVGEALGLDDEVAEMDRAEDGGGVACAGCVHRRPARKSAHTWLNSSARSHWTQCPVLATW